MGADSQNAVHERYGIVGAAEASGMDRVAAGRAIQCCRGCEGERTYQRCWCVAVGETAVGRAKGWVRRIGTFARVVRSDRERRFVYVDINGLCCHRERG